jgi:serine phosphatase RsbU (regulator of sigma subunit)
MPITEGIFAQVGSREATAREGRDQEPSLTSTESFAARAQRSEERRVGLWCAVLTAMLLLTIARRLLGGVVMSANAVFWPTVAVLGAALVSEAVLLRVLRRANRESRLLPNWIWRATAVADLLVPMAQLVIVGVYSPRGSLAALAGPTMLMLAIVVFLSVLRLKPRFTLITGLAAAGFHWALTTRAVWLSGAGEDLMVVYYSYGILLVLVALAATLVAREVRLHVVEAAAESAARERGEQAMATVQRDLAVARDIQAGLLPHGPPDFGGFDIAGMSRPADLTGGDYYHWQLLPDGRLMIVLADVTGHGIGPAIVMAVCRAYARASASVLSEPTPLMRRLNELLHTDLPADRFITLAIVILDSSGHAELLSAGHGPTFLYRAAGGEIQQFGGDGLPLGVTTAETYEPPIDFQMDAGDVLLLATDGFFEFMRAGDEEQFGVARLEKSLASNAGGDGATILRELDQAVRTFAAGSRQMDDMTAVVIKRTNVASAVGSSDAGLGAVPGVVAGIE